MKYPRIVIAATGSGNGKTTVTCSLLRALQQRGVSVCSFKCGPDYIDPLYHRNVIGVPTGNLDLFFTDEKRTRSIFCREFAGDVAVVEGVMGLYDGLAGIKREASTYHMAEALDAPIILVTNGYGKGRSVIAELKGFLDFDRSKRIAGVILNRVSAAFGEILVPVIEEELGIPVLGCLPNRKDDFFRSRYLGLVLPDEVKDFREQLQTQAKLFQQHVDVGRILEIARGAKEFPKEEETMDIRIGEVLYRERWKPLRIGVARDEAFCFYYRENREMLQELGAELVEFSPMADEHLPKDICGLWFGGGYPELHLAALSENRRLMDEIRALAREGIPIRGECGGFMYLGDSIEDASGRVWPMAGIHPGRSFHSEGRRRFGYVTLTAHETGAVIRGHEYHYYDCDNNGTAYTAEKPVTGKQWKCIVKNGAQQMGFPHLYYPSNPEFAKAFVRECRRWAEEREQR